MNVYITPFYRKIKINIFAFMSFGIMLYAEGLPSFSVLMAAAAIHETGHLLCLRLYKAPVREFKIEPFGALITYDPSALSLREETAAALSGIFFNLIGAFLASAVLQFTVNIYLLLFLFSNLFFAVVNLIPINGNDGSNAVFFWVLMKKDLEKAEKAKKTAAFIGRLLLLALSAVILVISGFNNSLFVIAVLLCLPC